jgi:hypothetical protein
LIWSVLVQALCKPHTYIHIYKHIYIERRGRVVKTPTSHSWSPGFYYWPRRPAILIEGFRGFPQSLQGNSGIVP